MKEKINKSLKSPAKSKNEETHKSTKVINRKASRFLFFSLLILVLGFVTYLNAGLFLVALVNGKPIWRIDLIRELEKQGGKQITEDLVNKMLIYQEANKKGVHVSSEDVDNEYKKIEDQFKSQGTTLQDAMAIQGVKESDLREEIRLNLLLKKLLEDRINVSDEEAKDYFEKNKQLLGENKSFEDLKDQIKTVLSNQKLSQAYQSFLEELKSSSQIKYFGNFN